jgi:replicative DNA helicase
MLQNIEAEQYVMGCYLLEGELFKETILKAEHFTDLRHSNLFKVMERLDKNNTDIDLTTVVSYISSKNPEKIQGVGSVSYLSELASAIPTTTNTRFFEQQVLDSWKDRESQKILEIGQREILDGEDTARNKIIDSLTAIEETGHTTSFDLKKSLYEIYDELESQQEGLTGIDTGYEELNRMTSGLQLTDLVIVAGRPSMGKTAFALNLGRNACDNDEVVAVFSLEMSEKQVLKRMLSIEGNIHADSIRKGFRAFASKEHTKFANAMGAIDKWNLYIDDDTTITVQGIRAKIRELQRKYPNKKILCIIDYLQLINTQGKVENRAQAIGEISRQLKLMAKDLNVCMLVLSQLSRSVEQRQDKHPLMSDIRESGNIEQDADVIIMLYRDDYYDKESESKNIVEVIINKQRNGPVGTVQLAMVKEYGKFVNIATRYENQEGSA